VDEDEIIDTWSTMCDVLDNDLYDIDHALWTDEDLKRLRGVVAELQTLAGVLSARQKRKEEEQQPRGFV
jgi:hypothetical protein